MQIYLIRHGSTAGNLEQRYVGSTDEALTEEAVQELRALRAQYPAPDLVFASPMKRCVQTARILFPELEPQEEEDLRECAFGDFEYKNCQELCGDKRYQAWIDSGGALAFPGGESREAFAERSCAAFVSCCRLAQERHCGSAAFVVHGGTIMAILDRYSRPHRDYYDWQIGNARGFAGLLAGGVLGGEPLRIEEIAALPPAGCRTGIEEQFVLKQNKKLRCGYTTGSCAAAAAKAAVEMLLGGHVCGFADLETPKGISLHLPVQKQHIAPDYAECAVRKYGGDDPDATDGLLIWAKAERLPAGPEAERETAAVLPRILIEGGEGVGRVTRPGLEQPVGAAAINRAPREMITREAASVCRIYGYAGRLKITVSVPEGAATAQKTFNPHLGIEGGISILGTSGIVVPMSEEALLASIRLEMQQKRASGERYLLVTPGNYGEDFIRRGALSQPLDAGRSMKCSNYVGETVDMAAELGFQGILFVAHIGKFVKVSGGIMNTHSASADCRAELLAAQAMRAVRRKILDCGKQRQDPEKEENRRPGPRGRPGAAGERAAEDSLDLAALAERILSTNTTEEAVAVLREEGILDITMEETARRIKYYLQRRCRGAIRTEAVLYSSQFGYLGETDGAGALMKEIVSRGERT